MSDQQDLKVFISHRDSVCDECASQLGRGAWITLVGERGALCLSCADLDHLVFLPPGDAALTRRAHKQSTLSAVVLKWSSARRRYERQGLLIEEAALASAESECLADADARARQRERGAARRADLDDEHVARFSARVRELFPACPPGTERAVAEHACLKHSGRIGRSASAKDLEEDAVRLAVAAHVRHVLTPYDSLLARGRERHAAREEVRGDVRDVLDRWRQAVETDGG